MHWTSHVSPCVFRLLVLRECGAHLCSLLPHFASSRLSTTNALILFTSSCDSCMLRCEKILVMELVTHHELGSEGLCHVSNMSENKKLEITNTSCKGVVMKHETMGAAVSAGSLTLMDGPFLSVEALRVCPFQSETGASDKRSLYRVIELIYRELVEEVCVCVLREQWATVHSTPHLRRAGDMDLNHN